MSIHTENYSDVDTTRGNYLREYHTTELIDTIMKGRTFKEICKFSVSLNKNNNWELSGSPKKEFKFSSLIISRTIHSIKLRFSPSYANKFETTTQKIVDAYLKALDIQNNDESIESDEEVLENQNHHKVLKVPFNNPPLDAPLVVRDYQIINDMKINPMNGRSKLPQFEDSIFQIKALFDNNTGVYWKLTRRLNNGMYKGGTPKVTVKVYVNA